MFLWNVQNNTASRPGREAYHLLLLVFFILNVDSSSTSRTFPPNNFFIARSLPTFYSTLLPSRSQDTALTLQNSVVLSLLSRLMQCLLTYSMEQSFFFFEKLTGSKVAKKFPEFYGTRRFITAFTRAHNLSLSWSTSIQSMSHIPLPENPA
jgi:hypothetical protein